MAASNSKSRRAEKAQNGTQPSQDDIISANSEESITSRKWLEEQFQTILRTAMDGFWIADIRRRFLEVNDAYCDLIGYSRAELLGMSIPDVEVFETPEETAEHIQQIIERGHARFKTRHRTKDGRILDVEVSTNFLPQPNGGGLFFVFLRDITERKRVQEVLQKAKDELEIKVNERTTELREANERLQVELTERKQAEENKLFIIKVLEILNTTTGTHSLVNEIIDLIKNWMDIDAVALRIQQGDDFPFYLQKGFSDDFVEKENHLICKNTDETIVRETGGKPILECTCGLVLSGRTDPSKPYFTKGGSFWTNKSSELLELKPEEDARINPRNRCIFSGYKSVALIPLLSDNEVIGLLQLNDKREGRFTQEIVRFLEGLSHSVTIAFKRKQAEEALCRTQRQTELILKAAGEGIYGVDSEGRTTFLNTVAAHLMGYEPEELLGQLQHALTHHTHPDGTPYPQEECPIYTAFRDGGVRNVSDEVFWRKDGTNFPVEYTSTPVVNDEGTPTGAVVVFRDITEHQRAEQELRQSEQTLRSMVEANPESLLLIDASGVVLEANQTVAHRLSKRPEEIISTSIYSHLPPDLAEERRRHIEEAIRSRQPMRFEDTRLGRYLDNYVHPILDAEGNVTRLAILSIDLTEHHKAQEQIEMQLSRLKSLGTIDSAILGTTDLRIALKTILVEAKAQLRADIAAIMLLNPHTLMLEFVANIGYRIPATARFSVRMGEGIAGKAAMERRTIAVPDLANAELSASIKAMAAAEGSQSIYATPLIVKGGVTGVLTILFRAPFHADQDWLDFFETLAGQAAIAIDSIRSFEGLQRGNFDLMLAYDATIEGWSRALDLRDKETEGHSQRVTEMTVDIARAMGMAETELVHVKRGALLHDTGKMGIPDAILLKPGKLTDEEWVIMRQHPKFAFDMLSPITYLRPALDIPYCHHEKWDGSGYPRGLKGEQISLAARIFALVDVWDALTSDRPYRKAWSKKKALEYIREQSRIHFDPRVVEAFFRLTSGQ